MKSDDELVRGFRRGDGGAFRSLYDRYRDRAYFYALALTRNEHAAEEAVQDAFLALVQNVRANAARSSFRGYLFAAVRSRAIDGARRDKLRKEVLESDQLDLFEGPAAAASPAWGDETGSLVGSALLSLPAEQREIIVLKIYDGMTFREIAELTGSNENTVASRYRYGCDKLRARLGGLVKDG